MVANLRRCLHYHINYVQYICMTYIIISMTKRRWRKREGGYVVDLYYLRVTGKRGGYTAFTLIVGHQSCIISTISFIQKLLFCLIIFFHFQFNECFLAVKMITVRCLFANNIFQFPSPWNVGLQHQILSCIVIGVISAIIVNKPIYLFAHAKPIYTLIVFTYVQLIVYKVDINATLNYSLFDYWFT